VPAQRHDRASGAVADLGEVRRRADSGEWNAAMAACELAIQQSPLDPAAYYTYALLSEHVGLGAAAIEALRRAVYLDRNFALAHYHLGRCLVHGGERAAAERSFANVLKLVSGRSDQDEVPLGEGLTVGDLRHLVRVHRGLLERRRS
jgi:chemotaxis protein methyltransferase CheR